MTSGGARNRNGTFPDPNSARSDARGVKVTALPSEGYRGPIPEYPLEDPSVVELERWAWAWRTPQACAWALPSQAWRVPVVAMWVRTFVRASAHDAQATILAQLHRLGDQVGLTTAGLREMGWQVAVDELAERRQDIEAAAVAGVPYDPRAEFKGQGGAATG